MTRVVPMFPLSTVLFPHALLPLHVFEPRYRRMMADCLAGDGMFGVVLIARGPEVGGGDERVDVGTVASVDRCSQLDDGRMEVLARGVSRISVERWLDESLYPRASVRDLPPGSGDGAGPLVASAERAVRTLRSLLSELGDVPAIPHDLVIGGRDEEAGWRLCELAPLALIDRQRLLACPGLSDRMELLGELSRAMAEDVVSLLAGGPGA